LGRTNGPGDGAGEVGALPEVLGPDGGPGRRGGCGRTLGGPGRGDPGGEATPPDEAGPGADDGAAGADGVAVALPAASRAPRSRRATGASTVLDADLTNSPMSFNVASTVLLSTPSSLASS
jgi:hypothetical protein